MAESFFRRWVRRKAESDEALQGADAGRHADASPVPAAERQAGLSAPPLPTMRDVAFLHAESDYSRFVAKGVDKAVRRAAMKKLFSDPHFNVMDGLDIYIDDYTKPSPLPAGMLAALRHANSTLNPQPVRAAATEHATNSALEPDAAADTEPHQAESRESNRLSPSLPAIDPGIQDDESKAVQANDTVDHPPARAGVSAAVAPDEQASQPVPSVLPPSPP